MKLKYTEVKSYRAQQLERQDSCCALCGEKIIDDAVLDHDHKTGLVRQVLHRGCNALLGKIENNMLRNRMTKERLSTWAEKLIEYITVTHTDVTHPTHKTAEDRKIAARKRIARKRNAKTTSKRITNKKKS